MNSLNIVFVLCDEYNQASESRLNTFMRQEKIQNGMWIKFIYIEHASELQFGEFSDLSSNVGSIPRDFKMSSAGQWSPADSFYEYQNTMSPFM